MSQKLITIILGLVIVGGLVWYIDRNYVSLSGNSSEKTSPSQASGTGAEENVQENLVYVTKGAATEIWQREPSGKFKKLYTDSDELFKLKKVSNSSSGGEVLAVTTNNSLDKLVMIDLNTAKQRIIKESFPSPSTLSLSPDGDWFLYSRFSNIEANYGYTLFMEQTDGPKIQEIARSESELIAPAWDSSSEIIYYGKTSGVSTEISSYNLESKKNEIVETFSEAIDWISVAGSDKIVLSVRNVKEANNGEILFLDSKDKSKTSILKFSGGKAAYAYLAPQGELAYLVAQYGGKIDEKTSGQIYILNTKDASKKAVQKGVQILGWR